MRELYIQNLVAIQGLITCKFSKVLCIDTHKSYVSALTLVATIGSVHKYPVFEYTGCWFSSEQTQ